MNGEIFLVSGKTAKTDTPRMPFLNGPRQGPQVANAKQRTSVNGILGTSTLNPLKLDLDDAYLFASANLLIRHEGTTWMAAKSGSFSNLWGRFCPIWVFI